MKNKNKQGYKGHITRGSYCKTYNIPPRYYGEAERMQNQGSPKHITTDTMEETRTRGKPW
jgi:hypothetical protein